MAVNSTPNLWTNFRGKPSVTVSPVGYTNVFPSLTGLPNDGADFGPDTTMNGGAGVSGAPYTDTMGIQEAINYIEAAGGGTIFLLPGVYTVGSTLEVTVPGVIIRGAMPRTGEMDSDVPPYTPSMVQAAAGLNAALLIVSSDPSAVSGGSTEGFRGFLCADVIFDGNASKQTAGDVVWCAAADSVFERCEIRNGFNNGLSTFDTNPANGGENMQLVNTHVHDNGSNGIEVGHADLRIDGGEIFGNGGAGIGGSGGNLGGLQVRGVNIYANSVGIDYGTGGSSSSSVNNGYVCQCSIDHNYTAGVILQGVIYNVSFSAVTFWDNGDGGGTPPTGYAHVIITEYSYGGVYATFSGCTFLGDSGAPNLEYEVYSTNGTHHTVFSGCSFVNLTRALAITGTTVVTITANPPGFNTVYQNTNPYAIILLIPVTLSPSSSAAANFSCGLSPTSTVSAPASEQLQSPAAGPVLTLLATVRVPAGWYYEFFSANGASIGTMQAYAAA